MVVESFLVFLSKIFFFTSYISNKGSFPKPLSPEEEKEYVMKAKRGDLEAREILIRHNLRLVAHIAKKYSNAGEADDLISVGSIGLIKGIESYEYGRGSQLATYVAKCIDNEILMYIRANKKHKNTVSLQESVGTDKEGNEITLMDILPMKEESVFAKVESDILYQKVLEIIYSDALSARERKIICLRYGINCKRQYTQLEVSKMMDISRSYVSRIEKKVVNKIAKELKTNQ